MGEGGWKGLNRDGIRWCGYFEAERFAALNTLSLTSGAVTWVGADGTLQSDSSNFVWDATNTRLGIGTDSPLQQFHSDAGTLGTNTIPGYFYGSTNRSTFTDTAGLTKSRATLVVGSNYTTNAGTILNVYSNNKDGILFVDGGGNVGVNTTIPSAFLETSGATAVLRLTRGGIGSFDMAVTGNVDGTTDALEFSPVGSNLGYSFLTRNTGGSLRNGFMMSASGAIAIGSVQPTQLFTISGGCFASTNTSAPTLQLNHTSGAFFVSGGAFFYKGDQGTITELAPR